MKRPTKKELKAARAKVEHLFTDTSWYEIMKDWEGACWHTSEVMCGILVGMQIVESRKKPARRDKPFKNG